MGELGKRFLCSGYASYACRYVGDGNLWLYELGSIALRKQLKYDRW